MPPTALPSPGEAADAWPALSLQAVMSFETQEKSAAMINSELLNVGESVAGVKLVEIRVNGVTMEYKGETRFMKIGRTRQ